MTPVRRALLKGGAALGAFALPPAFAAAQTLAAAPPVAGRRFSPQPDGWRTFEVTTRVVLAEPVGRTQVWLPVPAVDAPWQRVLESHFVSNGQAQMRSDGTQGVRMLHAQFAEGVVPTLALTSRVQTRNRATHWQNLTPIAPAELALRPSAQDLRHYTRATAMLPTDGIVRTTALAATRGARTDVDKARAIYDWVVANSWREPKVRGCGEGDIKTMLETGNLGGKCADINALFVGLCRAVGLPARDVYGIRLAPSAFGYKELSGQSANLKGAQHCRAEVYLQAHGWVAMDPADVAKVMRLETAQWLKTTAHPVVAPVNQHLFGGWEGNWLAWNTAHDVRLPGAQAGVLNFFMYPVAETAEGRIDSYAPDAFKYTIDAVELSA